MSVEINNMNDPGKTLKSVAARRGSESTETAGYLLNCPFCGWEADGPFDEWEDGYSIICCTNQACACEIKLPQPSVFAVAAWNNRASPFCDNCKEEDCECAMDDTCNMIRKYRKGR